ncbi:hypothetical protein HPB47_005735, partial [Ixodes persulcatus]
ACGIHDGQFCCRESCPLSRLAARVPQLLCHFHVAQAEWRWLMTAHNNVGRDQRRSLMSAFQKQCTCYKSQRASGAGRCLIRPQGEMSGACPSHEEEPQASSSVLLLETVSSTSGLKHQNTEDAESTFDALIAELRETHTEEKESDCYLRHLASATRRLNRLRQQKRGVGAIMAADAAFGLELRRGRTIKVQPTALTRRRPGVARGCKRVAAGRPP